MSEEKKPPYWKAKKPSYKRRAVHHDYTRAARYMITLKKAADIPVLSIVTGNPKVKDMSQPDAPKAISTRAGQCFEQAVENWCEKNPNIEVGGYVVMPDHIHICIKVLSNLSTGLSRAVASLMGICSKIYGQEISFFEKGFTDSIAYTEEQYYNQLFYLRDNPRRLLIKRLHPDFFFKRWEIGVNNVRLKAIGNIFLLKNPHRQVVRFSRKFTEEQVGINRCNWESCVENGGVLVSPFIHPIEKDMQKYAAENKGKIIRIVENGFAERYSPSASEFEMLSCGRLLLIASKEYDSKKEKMKYALAQQLNALAEMLASLSVEQLRAIPIK